MDTNQWHAITEKNTNEINWNLYRDYRPNVLTGGKRRLKIAGGHWGEKSSGKTQAKGEGDESRAKKMNKDEGAPFCTFQNTLIPNSTD